MREIGRGMGVTGRRRRQRYTCFERLNEGEQPFRFDYINFHAVFVSLSSSLSIVFPFENSIVGGEAREGEGGTCRLIEMEISFFIVFLFSSSSFFLTSFRYFDLARFRVSRACVHL